MALRIFEVPCLRDNYAYVVAAVGSPLALVIDPSEAEPVQQKLAAEGLQLAAILNTHHHWDHIGGNEMLFQAHADSLPVYAHRSDRGRVPCKNRDADPPQAFEAAGLSVQPLHVPGHTLGALAYLIEDAVFTGDTLFAGGCGRLFEGTASQMHHSLCHQLATLPPATRVFCGHEYTAANLRFAAQAEPDNPAITEKLAWAETRHAQGQSTMPSSIASECATNPFLRVTEPTLASRFPGEDPAAVFAAIRAAKDAF